ncbi:MAG: hypothetical protein SGARI_002112, partial [Bacillariaceae sp.]
MSTAAANEDEDSSCLGPAPNEFHFIHAAQSGFGGDDNDDNDDPTWSIAFCPFPMYGEAATAATSASVSHPGHVDGSKNDSNNNNNNRKKYYTFATCGGKKVRVYDFLATPDTTDTTIQPAAAPSQKEKDEHGFQLRRVYETNCYKEEEYWHLAFGKRREYPGQPKEEQQTILCVGGDAAVIDIYNVQSHTTTYDRDQKVFTLIGSTLTIQDLKVCPVRDDGIGNQTYNLLCSAADQELRLWNLDSFACICTFGGPPDIRLSGGSWISWHPLGTRIASGGKTDGKVAVWNVMKATKESPPCSYPLALTLDEAIQASVLSPLHFTGGVPFPRTQLLVKQQKFALSMHDDVHPKGVDCVQWVGEDEEEALLMSKSYKSNVKGINEVILWKPNPRPPAGSQTTNHELAFTNAVAELDPSVRDEMLEREYCCVLGRKEEYEQVTRMKLL